VPWCCPCSPNLGQRIHDGDIQRESDPEEGEYRPWHDPGQLERVRGEHQEHVQVRGLFPSQGRRDGDAGGQDDVGRPAGLWLQVLLRQGHGAHVRTLRQDQDIHDQNRRRRRCTQRGTGQIG